MKDNKVEELARRIVEHCGNHPSVLLEDKTTIVNEIIPEINHFTSHLDKECRCIKPPTKDDIIIRICGECSKEVKNER